MPFVACALSRMHKFVGLHAAKRADWMQKKKKMNFWLCLMNFHFIEPITLAMLFTACVLPTPGP